MQIGSCWTKSETKEDGKKTVTGISVTLDEAIIELYPQLRGVRFVLKPLTAEQRGTNEKAPHWRLSMFKPTLQNAAAAGTDVISDEEIPY